MPPRRKSRDLATQPPQLDLETVRAAFDAGKAVRVGIAASAQFPDGGTGRIRAIGDPATDGQDFIQVEVTIAGVKDVLPFAPADLTPATRNRLRVVTAADSGDIQPIGLTKDAALSAISSTTGGAAAPLGPAWAEAETIIDQSPTRKPARSGRKAQMTPGDSPAPAAGADTSPTPTMGGAVGRARSTKTDSARSRGKRAPVTITLQTTGEDNLLWQVQAQQGARTVIRSTSVTPLKAWQLVSGLDNPDLTEFVSTILAEHRTSTEAKAARLAEELAAVQAELADFP